MSAVDAISAYMPDLVPVRHDLHQHPEIGFQEHRTAEIVAGLLSGWGITVHRGIGGTGVVGIIENGPGRRIGLRADMDALPMEEQTNLPFRSVEQGRFHGCGHDGHTTILLGAARYLAEKRDFSGTVTLVFQPAEEGLGGARAMIADGLFDRFPCDEIYAIHNAPHLPNGQVALCPGAAMAAADFFDIKLVGRGMHAGMPHTGVDPNVAAGALIQALQTIVGRNIDPVTPAVVSVTQMRAGSAYNVVPDEAMISGTARSLDETTRAAVRQRIADIGEHVARAFGCRCELDIRDVFSVLHNRTEQGDALIAAASEIAGAENAVGNARPMMGSEDFADMLLAVPGAYAFIGQKSTGALHNPTYTFDDDIIPLGAGLLAELARRRTG